MIPRHAVHTQVERTQDFTKSVVGPGRIVLDKIAGDQHALGAPITGLVMIKYLLQGMGGDCTAQFAQWICEQVGIGQVKDPDRLPVSFISGHWNKVLPYLMDN